MRILVPIHSFEPGGVERVALRLARAWHDAGHEVFVLLGRDEGAARGQAPELTYVRHHEPISTAWWETLWMIVCLVRFLRRERVDVLFCPGNTYTVVCVAAKLVLPRRCPPVLAKVSNDLDSRYLPAIARPFYRVWLRIQGRILDAFVGLAPPMSNHIASFMGVVDERVLTIADPALSEGEFARLSAMVHRPAAVPHIVAVGRLVAQKNFPRLIAAFADYAPERARLTIAGEGPERRAIERAIARHGIAPRVVLDGHVEDIPALLESADLLALSSDYEGVPAAVIEALAAGLPVAATSCCVSMNWLLDGGKLGALARRGSTRSLGHAIQWALSMAPRPAEARQKAALFVIAPSAAAYLAAFRRLLAEPRAVRSAQGEQPVDA